MPWILVSLAASGSDFQLIEDTLLSLGAQSVTLKDAADNPILEPGPGETPLWENAIITGLFDDSHKAEILRVQIRQHLDNDKLDIDIASLPEQDWTRAWMDAFKPMQFGKRLWVCPKHLEPPEPMAVNLRLDPGLAFGTGTHPTTSLCLSWLDTHVNPRSGHRSVLDYGCGSGILAIAAILLGAEHADCVDIDAQALQASLENAKANQVLNQISTYLPQDHEAVDRYALVLSNILSGPSDSVRNAYSEYFDISPTEILGDWVLLHGKRKAL
jgi:ribosomal protein L11 methyltransferase